MIRRLIRRLCELITHAKPIITNSPSRLMRRSICGQLHDQESAGTVLKLRSPASPTWNSQATANHNDDLAVLYEEIDITSSIGLLRAGTNILAVHAMNFTAGDGDFVISARYSGPVAATEPRYMDFWGADGGTMTDTFVVDKAGEFVALIGHNGAGKTTLLKTICGHLKTGAGRVIYKEADITNRSPAVNVKNGLSFVHQDKSLFPNLSVLENLQLAAYAVGKTSDLEDRLLEVYRLFPILQKREKQMADTLSGGRAIVVVKCQHSIRPQIVGFFSLPFFPLLG